MIKVETPSTQPVLDLVIDRRDDESLDEADSDSDSDSEESEDEVDSSNSSAPNNDSVHQQLLTDQHSSARECTTNNRVPAPPFFGRNRAGTIRLPDPGALPREIFAHDWINHAWQETNDSSKLKRMVRHDSPREILIYASAFLLSGAIRTSLRAGCAILTRSIRDEQRPSECKGFLLEKTGPTGRTAKGKYAPYSQKRADLRAVIGALERHTWGSEGWKAVTIATRSGYVYNGMTRFVGTWKADNWHAKSRRGRMEVLNSDLWARALDLVNEQAYHGCEVQFWLLPREHGMETEDHARWLIFRFLRPTSRLVMWA